MLAPNSQSEKVTLIVRGEQFEDWTNIWVRRVWGEPYDQFRFTCAERDPLPGTYSLHQFKPDDDCQVRMAGRDVMKGVILTRQAAFNANQHGVQLTGVSVPWMAARSSIIHKTSSFDGKSFKEIAEEVLEPTKIKAKFEKIDEKKWEKMHCQPADTIFSFLERLARERKILITVTKEGELLFIGEWEPKTQGSIIEGKNLLECQAVVSIEMQRSGYIARGQTPANDENKMRAAAEQEAKVEKGVIIRHYSPILVPMEQPVWTDEEVKTRVENEAVWTEAQQIRVTAVVQGWQTPSGSLWEPGEKVTFKSQMAMIDGELVAQAVTYTQDNRRGSRTELLLVAPWGLNIKRGFIAPKPAPGRVDTAPPKTGS